MSAAADVELFQALAAGSASSPLPGSGPRDPVADAILAIGQHDPDNDWKLDVAGHALKYAATAPGLSKILSTDQRVIDAAVAYAKLDACAKKARCRFEFSMSLIALLALLFVLVAMFLSVVPPELGFALRFGIAAVLGFFLAEFLVILARRAERPIVGYENVLRIGLPVTAVAVQYIFPLVPHSLANHVEDFRNFSILFLIFTLIVADTNSGGIVAWLVNLVWRPGQVEAGGIKVDVSKLPLKQQWYELRGHAEDQRRRYFLGVALSDKGNGIDLLAHKLEYIRRHHIEVQQGYFEKLSKDNLVDSMLPERLRKVASAVLLVALVLLGLLYFALDSEQSGGLHWFPAGSAAWLLERTRAGWGDLAVLASLFAVGVYGYSQLTTTLLQKRATSERYANAWAQLRRATSPRPGVAELALGHPLSVARKAAVVGDVDGVVDLVRQVNRLLAAEFGNWSPTSRYKIEYQTSGGRTFPRLSSTARLSPDNDFEWITRDLDQHGLQRRQARKTGTIRATRAVGGEQIEAHSTDGFQGFSTAKVGEFIATKLDRDLQVVRNPQGNLDQWVIKPEKFDELYTAASATDPELFQPTGKVIEVLPFEGGIDIIAAWGEHQAIGNGYLVRNGDDVYGIDAATFHTTYDFVDMRIAAA
ncbi:MAG: hypothetical protein SH859_04720 [Hyphomicrobium aestuarii]|nr:hypothetical protein [Hyphomicrobium aestuarii]